MHGWGDLQDELRGLSLQGDWAAMGSLIDDEILDAFAVVAPRSPGRETSQSLRGRHRPCPAGPPENGISDKGRRDPARVAHALE